MKKLLLLSTLTMALMASLTAQQSDWFWLSPWPQGNDLNSISMVSNTTAYAVGNYGTVLKTTDLGENWEFIETGFTTNFSYVKFFDAQNGCILDDYGLQLRTTDGGTTWETITAEITDSFWEIFFTDPNTGYAFT